MREETLYSFFCAEKYSFEYEKLIINIDGSLLSIGEITQYIGMAVYKDYPFENPIMGRSNQYYFGGTSPDAFYDCLTDYLLLRDKEKFIRINFLKKGKDVTDNEIYLFLYVLANSMFHYDFDSRLQVYVSKEILNIYLKEAERLLVLDTNPDDPNDYVQY